MKPNILLLFPDEWRGDWWELSDRPPGFRTPAIRGIAERGTVFTWAHTPSPLCAPARACLATGRRYENCGVRDNDVSFPPGLPTVYGALRDGGYHVMGSGKFDLHKPEYSWGIEGRHRLGDWGFSDGIDSEGKIDGVEAYRRGSPGPYLHFLSGRGRAEAYVADFGARGLYGTFPGALDEDEYCDNWIAGNAGRLLDRAPGDRPFFLQVNFAGPHFPFDVTEAMHGWYRDTDFPEPSDTREIPGVDHRAIRRNYAAMIRNIDSAIARILGHPRLAKERNDTVVIVSSDHGDMLGDRGHYGKCLPYNGSTHVPLVLAGPGIRSGARIDSPVSLLDLSATILELADCGAPGGMDSVSLVPDLAGGRGRDRVITSALSVRGNPEYSWKLALDSRYKYIRRTDGGEALYDRRDYCETTDLSAERVPELRRLRACIEGRGA